MASLDQPPLDVAGVEDAAGYKLVEAEGRAVELAIASALTGSRQEDDFPL